MKIIVGLGNPGPKYETTRHNAGFLAIDYLVDHWKATGPNDVHEGETFSATVGGEKVLLVKPLTFMNNSGKCVAPLYKFYKCAPEDLIVIHDELDIKINTLRLKTGGGAGGHNGIKSLDAHLGGGQTGYHRIRIGVGRPQPGDRIDVADYVLGRYTDAELDDLSRLFDKVAAATELVIRGDIKKAMNEYNREEKPAQQAKDKVESKG